MAPVVAMQHVELPVELPEAFEPKRANRWVLCLEPIEPYVVKRIECPSVCSDEGRASAMTITMHNVVGSKQNGTLKDWIRSRRKNAGTLRFFDVAGNVDETWRFDALPTSLEFDPLDYESEKAFVTRLTVEITNFTIENHASSVVA